MKKQPTSKDKKKSKDARKEKPSTNAEPVSNEPKLSEHLPAPTQDTAATPATPPPAAPNAPREKKEPWDKAVPFAKDVKEQNLTVKLGDFCVTYSKVEAANKDQRWTITNASGAVVASHSQYWPAVLDARRRSIGKS